MNYIATMVQSRIFLTAFLFTFKVRVIHLTATLRSKHISLHKSSHFCYRSGYESGGGRRRTDYRSDYSEYDHHGGPASSSRRRGHQHEHSYISEDEYRHGGSNGRRHRQGAAGGGDRLHPPRSSAKKKEGTIFIYIFLFHESLFDYQAVLTRIICR